MPMGNAVHLLLGDAVPLGVALLLPHVWVSLADRRVRVWDAPQPPRVPGSTEIVEGPITISPEHLGVLKEQLQAQLKEIEIAEKAVADAEKKAK